MRPSTIRFSHSARSLRTLALLPLLAGAAAFGQVHTDPAGGNPAQPFNNTQPSLAIHFAYQEFGIFGDGVPLRMFGYSDTTMAFLNVNGWMSPDGRALSTTSHSFLFGQIGYTYGGDGTSFNIPDVRGRALIGEGTAAASGTTFSRGQVVGETSTTLTTDNLPAHAHTHPDGTGGFTSVTGGGQPVSNMQPSLAINYSVNRFGVFPPRFDDDHPDQGGAYAPADTMYGQIQLLTATPLANYPAVPADGSTHSISQNSALFSLYGTYYGGNGTTNFAYPDLRGTAAMGANNPFQNNIVGTRRGGESVALTPDNLPPHAHTVTNPAALPPTGVTGSGTPFDNMQPSLSMTYAIAFNGVFPGGSGPDFQSGYIGEIMLFGGNFVPAGYLPCDGRLVSVAEYEVLFVLMGYTFGGSDSFFALPDLRGITPVGAYSGLAAGTMIGSDGVALSMDQMPEHDHVLPTPGAAGLLAMGGLMTMRRRR